MSKITFKADSQPHIIYTALSQGGSLTHEEAVALGINRLAQRISDMKKKFEDAGAVSPLMVVSERTSAGVNVARYFFKGYGSSLESRDDARVY